MSFLILNLILTERYPCLLARGCPLGEEGLAAGDDHAGEEAHRRARDQQQRQRAVAERDLGAGTQVRDEHLPR